jgi:hypothetical protein
MRTTYRLTYQTRKYHSGNLCGDSRVDIKDRALCDRKLLHQLKNNQLFNEDPVALSYFILIAWSFPESGLLLSIQTRTRPGTQEYIFLNVLSLEYVSRDSSAGTATRLQTGRPIDWGTVLDKRFSSSPQHWDRFWGPPSHQSNGYLGTLSSR